MWKKVDNTKYSLLNYLENYIDKPDNADIEVIKKLIADGADVNAYYKYTDTDKLKAYNRLQCPNFSAVAWSYFHDKFDVFKILVDNGANAFNSQLLTEKLNIEYLNCFLEAGFAYSMTEYDDKTDETMSMLISYAENTDSNSVEISLLLEHGADYTFQTSEGLTVFDVASPENLECIKDFIKRTNPVIAYFLGTRYDDKEFDIEFAKKLVIEAKDRPTIKYKKNCSNKKCYDMYDNEATKLPTGLNAFDVKGYTLLTEAIEWSFTDLVKLLIKQGTNISQEDMCGHLPVALAKYLGNKEISKLLKPGKPKKEQVFSQQSLF